MPGVGRDDRCPGKNLGEDDERAIAGIHLGILLKKFQSMRTMLNPPRKQKKPPCVGALDGGEQAGAVGLEQMTGLAKHDFGRGHRLIDQGENPPAPVMPLVPGGQRADDWTSVDDVFSLRSLHGRKGQAGRL